MKGSGPTYDNIYLLGPRAMKSKVNGSVRGCLAGKGETYEMAIFVPFRDQSMVTSALNDPVINLYHLCTKLLYLVFIYGYIITYKQAP